MKSKLKTNEIIMLVISIFLLLSMFVFFNQNAFVAILMGVLGILLLPWINRKINQKIIKENKMKNGVKIALEIIMFVLILFNVPTTENVEDNNQVAKENITNSIEVENTLNTVNTINNSNTNNTTKENVTNVNNSVNTTTNTANTTSTTKTTEGKGQTTSTVSSSKSSSNSTSKQSSSKQSSSSGASSTTNSQTVYVTPTGKRYHLSPTCGGKNSKATTLSNAKSMGLTPCKKCAQ